MIKKPLVLADDVMLIPVDKLAVTIREQLQLAAGDVAITRPGSRTRTRLVDATTAEFLEGFREPATIVNAVLHFSTAREIGPKQVLDQAFPVLKDLINAGWLVVAGSAESAGIRPSLRTGQVIDGWEVLSCVQVLEDTEIHQVRDGSGGLAALKFLRPGRSDWTAEVLEREAAILRHLDGSVGPRLLGTGVIDDRPYLLLSWVPGRHAAVAAEAIRRCPDDESQHRFLYLACGIAAAYARLHAQGIVHGDVHTRNLIVADDWQVTPIDFGLARLVDSDGTWGEAPRGGINFFLEPEYAVRRLAGLTAPQATMDGEQYAIAALLYYLLTGFHYVDFALEKELQLRQVIECSPLPFTRRGLAPWPDIESCLTRALSKDPAGRFPSVAALAEALAEVTPPPAGDGAEVVIAGPGVMALDRLRSDSFDRLVNPEALLEDPRFPPPTCSLTYGAAGIAYAFYRLACLEDDARQLALADRWVVAAARGLGRDNAFYHAGLDLTPDAVGTISPYHTASGVHAVQTLISQAMGDLVSRNEAVLRFIATSSDPCRNLDLTLGRSGTLLACAMLREAIPDDQPITETGNRLMAEVWSEVHDYGSIAEGEEIRYLGIAHGWAGLIYAALRWCSVTGAPPPDGVNERLSQLAACAEPGVAVGGLRWSRLVPAANRLRNVDYMPGWCNGVAGFVHLWILAHRLLRDDDLLALAERAAIEVRDDPASIANLCCGLAGRSYALLSLYTYTGSREWLRAARYLATLAVCDTNQSSFAPHSLYKGNLGIALLATELAHPELSCMPFFGGEGWPESTTVHDQSIPITQPAGEDANPVFNAN